MRPISPLALTMVVACSLCACDGGPAAPMIEPAVVLTASVSVVMDGLDSPRGLAWGPEGGLYVVEAGAGVPGGPCVDVPRGRNCYSATGAVTRLWKGRQERVVEGLPSIFNPAVNDIAGAHDIGFVGLGEAVVTIGWGAPPAARAGLGDVGALMGTLIAVRPSGTWRVLADLAAFEQAENPAGGPVDSNPYGVLAEPGVRYVADAGGNDLLAIRADGGIAVIATLPPTPAPMPWGQSEPVPTEVQRGPDGALYLSTLTGVPFLAGSAAIHRVGPSGAVQPFATGFKTITDFDFGPDGSLYVLEYASDPLFFGGPGRLTRVAPDGTRTPIDVLLANPTAVLAGPDGALYVSNRGNVAGVGEVLRIVP